MELYVLLTGTKAIHLLGLPSSWENISAQEGWRMFANLVMIGYTLNGWSFRHKVASFIPHVYFLRKLFGFDFYLTSLQIVLFQFGLGANAHYVILELYAQGNIILTDSEFTVLTLLRSHRYVFMPKLGMTSIRVLKCDKWMPPLWELEGLVYLPVSICWITKGLERDGDCQMLQRDMVVINW